MSLTPIAAVVVRDAMSQARSALPDAPVVPDVPQQRTKPLAAAPRRVLAQALVHVARVVEPAPTMRPTA